MSNMLSVRVHQPPAFSRAPCMPSPPPRTLPRRQRRARRKLPHDSCCEEGKHRPVGRDGGSRLRGTWRGSLGHGPSRGLAHFKAQVVSHRTQFPRIVVKYLSTEDDKTTSIALPEMRTAYVTMADVTPKDW